MAITEHTRHQLHRALIESLGEEEAATLMEHLPPVGWADVATKSDIDNLRVATKSDIDNLRVATKTDFDNLRADFDNLRTATKTDFDNLRTSTKTDFDNLRTSLSDRMDKMAADLRTEMANQFREAQRWTLTTMFGLTALATTVLGVIITVTR